MTMKSILLEVKKNYLYKFKCIGQFIHACAYLTWIVHGHKSSHLDRMLTLDKLVELIRYKKAYIRLTVLGYIYVVKLYILCVKNLILIESVKSKAFTTPTTRPCMWPERGC